jgi:hypothetical protein
MADASPLASPAAADAFMKRMWTQDASTLSPQDFADLVALAAFGVAFLKQNAAPVPATPALSSAPPGATT